MGYEMARHLRAAGADVAIFDIKDAQEAADRLNSEGGTHRAIGVGVDVADEDSVRSGFDTVAKEFGAQPRILINNAAYNEIHRIVSTPLEAWRKILDVDLQGPFLAIREFGRRFIEHDLKGGSIINTTSLNSVVSTAGLAAYNSAKAALAMLTKTAALEFAELDVRVNAIAPSLTETPLAEGFFGESPEVPAAFVEQMPLGRVGRPDDIARGVLFLASTLSNWVTSHTLHVDGGAHLMGQPDNWEIMKEPLGLKDPTPADWATN